MSEHLGKVDDLVQQARLSLAQTQEQWLGCYPHVYYCIDHEGVLYPFGTHNALDDMEDTRVKIRVKNMPINKSIIDIFSQVSLQSERSSLVSGSIIDTLNLDTVDTLAPSYRECLEKGYAVLRKADQNMRFMYQTMVPDSLIVFVNDSRTSAIPHLANYILRHQLQSADHFAIHAHVPVFMPATEEYKYNQQLLPVIQNLRAIEPVPLKAFCS